MLIHVLVCVYQVSIRTVLCGWNRRCGTSNIPHGKKHSHSSVRHNSFEVEFEDVASAQCCRQVAVAGLRCCLCNWLCDVCV